MAGELTTTISFSDGDQITSAKLNEVISGASFTTSAITGTTLAVTGGKLKVGTITASEIGAGAVTTTGLLDLNVTTGKLADGAVTAGKLAANSVGTSNIIAQSITFTRISAGTLATKAYMESQTASLLVTPDVVHYAPGMAKAWGEFKLKATREVTTSHNVTSVTTVTDTSSLVTIATDMKFDNYVVVISLDGAASFDLPATHYVGVFGKDSAKFYVKHPTADDDLSINFVVFGTANT